MRQRSLEAHGALRQLSQELYFEAKKLSPKSNDDSDDEEGTSDDAKSKTAPGSVEEVRKYLDNADAIFTRLAAKDAYASLVDLAPIVVQRFIDTGKVLDPKEKHDDPDHQKLVEENIFLFRK